MHSNNYFVQDVRGDVRWGGGHHVNIEYGGWSDLPLRWSAEGRGRIILIFPTYFCFPLPPPST